MGQYRSSFANQYEERTDNVATTYTLVQGDEGKTLYCGSAGNTTITIPLNATVPFAVGTRIELVRNHASNTLTVAATGGVTIRNTGTALTVLRPYGKAILTKIATDEWVLSGSLTGAFS